MSRTLRSQVYDPKASLRACLEEACCRVCGGPPGSAHHIVPKGSPHFGDDVTENLACLCGSGTTGCHGLIENHDVLACSILGTRLTPENIEYVLGHIGEIPGRVFLLRRYHLDLP